MSVNASQGAWAGTGYSDQPSGYSPSSVSEDGRPDDEGDDAYTTIQKGRKRRRDSDVGEDDTRKSRKTAVAWRKLRCDGAKPACSHCMARKFQCEYVPVQRRRGPGKALKGGKSKKGPTTGHSEASTSLDRVMGEAGSSAMSVDTERTSLRRPTRRRTRRTRSASAESERQSRKSQR
ncbi:hypothetical protein C0991_003293 [Blastosporella zonata]|nr:hypothetical protein C0991_003293 [Blastosporella zonata]